MSEEDRQKLREYKKNLFCGRSQEELQQRQEQIIEQRKQILERFKS